MTSSEEPDRGPYIFVFVLTQSVDHTMQKEEEKLTKYYPYSYKG